MEQSKHERLRRRAFLSTPLVKSVKNACLRRGFCPYRCFSVGSYSDPRIGLAVESIFYHHPGLRIYLNAKQRARFFRINFRFYQVTFPYGAKTEEKQHQTLSENGG